MKTGLCRWFAAVLCVGLFPGLTPPGRAAEAAAVTELPNSRIFVHDMTPLPASNVQNVSMVDWSPKANQLVFDRMGLSQYYNVYTVTPEGFRLNCLTLDRDPATAQLHEYSPSWHPSGNFIVFSGQNRGSTNYRRSGPGTGWHCNLWLGKADGSQLWQITDLATRYGNPMGATMPTFSPDGKKLLWTAFTGKPAARTAFEQRSLCLADFDIKDGKPVVANEQYFQPGRRREFYETYGFSPDGNRILFAANAEQDQPWYCMDICTIDRGETELKVLASNVGGWDRYASVSPDGRKIVWSSSRTFMIPFLGPGGTDWERYLRAELWIMDADGGSPRQLTFFNSYGAKENNGRRAFVGDTAWSPDGTRLAMVLYRETRNFDVVSEIVFVTLGKDPFKERPAPRPGTEAPSEEEKPQEPAEKPNGTPPVPKW